MNFGHGGVLCVPFLVVLVALVGVLEADDPTPSCLSSWVATVALCEAATRDQCEHAKKLQRRSGCRVAFSAHDAALVRRLAETDSNADKVGSAIHGRANEERTPPLADALPPATAQGGVALGEARDDELLENACERQVRQAMREVGEEQESQLESAELKEPLSKIRADCKAIVRALHLKQANTDLMQATAQGTAASAPLDNASPLQAHDTAASTQHEKTPPSEPRATTALTQQETTSQCISSAPFEDSMPVFGTANYTRRLQALPVRPSMRTSKVFGGAIPNFNTGLAYPTTLLAFTEGAKQYYLTPEITSDGTRPARLTLVECKGSDCHRRDLATLKCTLPTRCGCNGIHCYGDWQLRSKKLGRNWPKGGHEYDSKPEEVPSHAEVAEMVKRALMAKTPVLPRFQAATLYENPQGVRKLAMVIPVLIDVTYARSDHLSRGTSDVLSDIFLSATVGHNGRLTNPEVLVSTCFGRRMADPKINATSKLLPKECRDEAMLKFFQDNDACACPRFLPWDCSCHQVPRKTANNASRPWADFFMAHQNAHTGGFQDTFTAGRLNIGARDRGRSLAGGDMAAFIDTDGGLAKAVVLKAPYANHRPGMPALMVVMLEDNKHRICCKGTKDDPVQHVAGSWALPHWLASLTDKAKWAKGACKEGIGLQARFYYAKSVRLLSMCHDDNAALTGYRRTYIDSEDGNVAKALVLDPFCLTVSVVVLTGPDKYRVSHLVNASTPMCSEGHASACEFDRQAIPPSGRVAYLWNTGSLRVHT